MISNRLGILFIVCSLATGLKAAPIQQDTLKVAGSLDEWLCRYLYFYKDDGGLAGPETAKKLWLNGKFAPCKDQLEFFGGYRHKNVWFTLKIKNAVKYNQNLLWSFNTSDLEFVLFDITGSKIRLIDSASSHTIISKRNLPVRGVTFKIGFEPEETKTILVKVYPINIDYLNFPTNLTTTEKYFLWEKEYASTIFFYFGIFLTTLVVNVCLGILTRRRIHLWHAAYIFAIILWSLNEFLFDSLVMPEWLFESYTKLPKVFFILLALTLGVTVFQLFINQRTTQPKLFKVFQIYKGIIIGLEIVFFFSIFFYYPQSQLFTCFRIAGAVLEAVGLFLFVLNIIIGCYKKQKIVLIYTLVSIFLILSILNNQLYEWFDYTLLDIYPNTLTVSIATEIFFLTIAFAYNTKLELQKQVTAQRDLMLLTNSLSQKIIFTLEEERKRTATDLHDEVGGSLAILKMAVESSGYPAERSSGIFQIINKMATSLRNIAHDLMPPEFENMSLVENLTNFYEKLNVADKTRFEFIISGDEFKFDKQKSLMIYRILSEISANVVKHAGATKAVVQLTNAFDHVMLIAEDNGIGFIDSNNDGIGLQSIRSRVDFLKGTLDIDSGPSGTTIIIKIPIY